MFNNYKCPKNTTSDYIKENILTEKIYYLAVT